MQNPHRRKEITNNYSHSDHYCGDRHSYARDDRLKKCHSERSEAPSAGRPLFVALTRATSPASTGEHTPGRVVFRGAYIAIINNRNKKSAAGRKFSSRRRPLDHNIKVCICQYLREKFHNVKKLRKVLTFSFFVV